MSFAKAGVWGPINFSNSQGLELLGTLTVYTDSARTIKATLYSDQTAATVGPNPVSPDTLGNFTVYAAPGLYYGTFTHGGTSSNTLIPVAPLTSASAAFNVVDYGAKGDGVTDDSAAFQAAITAAGATAIPGGYVYIPAGNYIINSAVNCTNITSETESASIVIRGAGKGATRIATKLGSAVPLFDFAGSGRAKIADLWINGVAGGSQTAALRFARGANGFGDQPVIEDVVVDGTFAQAALCFICDLWVVNRCDLNTSALAPVAIVWDNTDVLSVGGAALGSPVCTIAHVMDTTMYTSTRSGFLGGNFEEISFDGMCYCNMSGTATQAIELISGQSKYVWAHIRVESNSSTVATSVMSIAAGQSCTGGRLTGDWTLHNSGTLVTFGDTTATLTNMEIHPSLVTHQGTGSLSYFSANGGFYNCLLWNTSSNLAVGDASHNTPYGNIVFQGSGALWTFGSGNSSNIQLTSNGSGYVQLGNFSTGASSQGVMSLNGGTNHWSAGSGAPTSPGNVTPVAGDYYFRTDTPSTANQRLYVCTTGGGSPVWSGIV